MTPDVEFRVYGRAAAQGSKRAYIQGGRAVMTEAGGDKHANWRGDVTKAAREAWNGRGPITGPAAVTIQFYFPLPKSDPYRVRHATPIDIDKACRSILDSLVNAGVLSDDALVFNLCAQKHYARGAQLPGALISVGDHSEPENRDRARLKAEAKEARRVKNA